MILHHPEIKIKDGEVSVSSRIEFQTPIPDVPERLWFKFPESHQDWVTDRADGFVAATLLLAMAHAEDIDVRGNLSPRLLLGMQEYQRVFNFWHPYLFKLVDIRCNDFNSLSLEDVKGGIASAFSGGVDSFYTLWTHLPKNDNNPHSQVSYALFGHGFDIPLEDDYSFRVAKEKYEKLFETIGIELLTAQTNIQDFGMRSNWGSYHGSILAGSALVLGRLIKRFYVPSTHTYNDLMPWGSDPRIDHLISTETMETVHDGASKTRVLKTSTLANWPVTYSGLRVCWARDGINNCSRCEKCIRTMITLDMVGALKNYVTFPLPLKPKFIRRCRYLTTSDFSFPREIANYALKIGRYDIVVNLGYAYLYSFIMFYALKIMKKTKRHVGKIIRKLQDSNFIRVFSDR